MTCTSADAEMCAACRADYPPSSAAGIVGTPELRQRASTVWLEREAVAAHGPARLAAAPLLGDGERARWLVVGDDGWFHLWDLDARSCAAIRPIPDGVVDLGQPVTLRVSRDGRFAALANTRGLAGAVVDVATGAVTVRMQRDGYHSSHSDYSVAFVDAGGRTLVVHATRWNRLDAADARTGELVTAREPHALDYFHAGLHVSPGEARIADTGWVWGAAGIVRAWSLDAWLGANVFESEDGPSVRRLGYRLYDWNNSLVWLDDDRVALAGYGSDVDWMLPAARIVTASTGVEVRWFYGPSGWFAFDRHLVSISARDGAAVWDVDTGERIVHEPAARARWYHPGARVFVEVAPDGDLVAWRLCGHDAGAPWLTDGVRVLARSLHAGGAPSSDGLRVLGDALEEAGCPDAELLAHCRAGVHRGPRCWVVDRLLARL